MLLLPLLLLPACGSCILLPGAPDVLQFLRNRRTAADLL